MSQVSITYYGMDGTGENVTKAKANAGRKIESALSGSYSPTIIGTLGTGFAAIVYRMPAGWHYKLIETGDTGALYGNGSWQTSKECITYARRHLADLNRDITLIAENDSEGVQQWYSKDKFTLAYRAAIAAGHTDIDAHTIACHA